MVQHGSSVLSRLMAFATLKGEFCVGQCNILINKLCALDRCVV